MNRFTPRVSLEDRWGLKFRFQDLDATDEGVYEAAIAFHQPDPEHSYLDLPETVSWHSALYFDGLDEAWRSVYGRGSLTDVEPATGRRTPGLPVIVERPFGAGTMVLCSDSYLFSNEAMLDERHSALLAWLVGRHHRVVFDEAHLGVVARGGVMPLALRYRLHGVLAGSFVLAALFVWKNVSSLVPPYSDGKTPSAVVGFGPDSGKRLPARIALGKDSAAGLKNLLKRSIAQRDLAAVCLAEWRRSFPAKRPDQERKVERMEAVAQAEQQRPMTERDPVAAYRTMADILSEDAPGSKKGQQT
jgi:hypothetical protein